MQEHPGVASASFMELYLPTIKNLSKIKIIFKISKEDSRVGLVKLNFSILFDSLYTISRFEFSHNFGQEFSAKTLFYYVLATNLITVFLVLIYNWLFKTQNPGSTKANKRRRKTRSNQREEVYVAKRTKENGEKRDGEAGKEEEVSSESGNDVMRDLGFSKKMNQRADALIK